VAILATSVIGQNSVALTINPGQSQAIDRQLDQLRTLESRKRHEHASGKSPANALPAVTGTYNIGLARKTKNTDIQHRQVNDAKK
jgi:hypothetical protein